jgi:hypothetical protein
MSTEASPDWSRAFDDPIPLPDGRVLETLHDAGHYVTALPKTAQHHTEWQTAAEMLILAATEGWPVMFADIAMRRALGADKTTASTPKPRRKPPAKRYKVVR